MSFIISKEPSGSGTIAIGGIVSGGLNNLILFITPDEILAQDETFLFEEGKLTAPRISSTNGYYEFPDGSISSDGEQVLQFSNFTRIEFNNANIVDASIQANKIALVNVAGNENLGFAQLTGGTVDLANTEVQNAGTIVMLSPHTSSVNAGFLSVVINDGVGFTINSSNPLDDSYISFMVIHSGL